MPKWIKDSDVYLYLKAVYMESQHPFFRAFDLLGIVLLSFPHWAERLTQDVSLVRTIGAGILLVSFVLANFTLYRKNVLENSLVKLQLDSFKITRVDWVEQSSTDNDLRIADKIKVSFRVFLECTNPLQIPTTVEFTIDSIDSEWQTSVHLTSIALDLRDPQASDGRLRLAELESKALNVSFGIPFDGPDDKSDFGYLGSLSKMVVVLAVEQPRQKIRHLHIAFDIIEMHQLVKNQLVDTMSDRLEKLHRGQRFVARNLVREELSTMIDIVDKLRIDQ